jgi:hypothetical protein
LKENFAAREEEKEATNISYLLRYLSSMKHLGKNKKIKERVQIGFT